MKKYKILIPLLLLKNNTMGKYGEEVTAEQLTDTTDNLVAGKYIEEVIAPGPTAAELQKQADDAKALEISSAKTAVETATTALTTATANAEGAAPELKEAADAAVVTATANLQTAQANLDALTAPAPDAAAGKKTK